MKVVQVNAADLVGRRFNGYDLHPYLAERGVESRHLVWRRASTEPFVEKLFDITGRDHVTQLIQRAEARRSLHSTLHLHSFALPLVKTYRQADLAHHHIVHDGYFSMDALPWLARRKPTVWTWHDPWAMTGHCIYPMECGRWETGCGACPDLKAPFPMREDRTAQQIAWKRKLYAELDADIILASRWMMDMARRSPITAGLRFHHIPFGIDLDKFRPRDVDAARDRLGILPGSLVICLRAFNSPYKGLPHFMAALKKLRVQQPLCLITFHEKNHFDSYIGQHQIIDLGWTDSEQDTIDAYTATDFFVMPSTAEAFGMMAIEAMACGKPVICFEGTSLPEVVFAPESGLAVPMGDVDALAEAMNRWIADEGERRRRGDRAREIAERHYDIRLQADRVAALYAAVLERHRRGDKSGDVARGQDAEQGAGRTGLQN